MQSLLRALADHADAAPRTDGYLKSDLEGMLTTYLQANETELAADQTFAPYFETIASRSPTKQSTETRTRRRTSRYVPGTTTFGEPST